MHFFHPFLHPMQMFTKKGFTRRKKRDIIRYHTERGGVI